jgi:alpha-glucosidase
MTTQSPAMGRARSRRVHWNSLQWTLAGALGVVMLSACGESAPAVNDPVQSGKADFKVVVQPEPFAIRFQQGENTVLASNTEPSLPVDPASVAGLLNLEELIELSDIADLNGFADLSNRFGTLGFALDLRVQAQTPLAAYGAFVDVPIRWFHATRATAQQDGSYRVETDDPLGRYFTLRLESVGDGAIAVEATLSDMTAVSALGISFARDADERFLGFGERSNGVDQTGRFVEVWAEEGPFSAGVLRPATEPLIGETWQGPSPIPGTNFPMPWFLSSRGYGFMLDSYAYNAFRLNRDGVWNVETRDAEKLRFVVFAGPEPATALQRFVAHNGKQPEPAEWFFGPWYQPVGDGDFRRALITNWREWDVPVTVSQTYAHYLPCASQFGRRDALREETALYHENGYRVTTYVNSFVCNQHPEGAYEEGDAQGYFIQLPTGGTYPIPYVAYPDSSSAVVDFTHPDASAWWQGLILEAIEDGYDGWMEDFGEYVPPAARTHDGQTGLQYHNRYCTDYHRSSHELTWPLKGRDFAQFIRCGNLRTAPYARIVWGADPSEDNSQADGLGAAISQGISMGLSGIAYWGSDIGGFHSLFTGTRTSVDTLIRWIEFGAFSGVMRMQEDGYEIPNVQGERVHIWEPEVLPSWRRYTKLRTQLFPYIWEAALDYQRSGMPIMRHMALVTPQDPMVYDPAFRSQYLFGDDILVAPVIAEGQTQQTVYLPEGQWCEFWTHVTYEEASGAFVRTQGPGRVDGGQVVTVDAPLEQIPLFVRAGSRIPMLPPETDTLTNIGTAPGLVDLADVRQQVRDLVFGAQCD